MGRLFKKRLIKQITSIFILSVYFISTFSTNVYAYQNASQVQQDYISLMHGAYISDFDDNIYSYDDLRNIAIFLSNSYVPFYTSLDADSESYSKQKSISMLRTIGFSKDSAAQIVDEIYTSSLESASQVYIDFTELGSQVSDGSTYANSFGRSKPKATGSNLSVTFALPVIGAVTSAADTLINKVSKGGDSSCIVTGDMTPSAVAITLAQTALSKIRTYMSGVINTANTVTKWIKNLFSKTTGTSGMSASGEQSTDASQFNVEALRAAINMITDSLSEAGVPASEISVNDVVIAWGLQTGLDKKVERYTPKAEGDKEQILISDYVDLQGSILTSMQRGYVYHTNNNPKVVRGLNELYCGSEKSLLYSVCHELNLPEGTLRFASSKGPIFGSEGTKAEDCEILSIDSGGHIGIGVRDEETINSWDRPYKYTEAGSGNLCMTGTQVAVSVNVAGAHSLYLLEGHVTGGNFVYDTIYNCSDKTDKKYSKFNQGNFTTGDPNKTTPRGTLADAGYMSAVADDFEHDQFTPLTLYMFQCIMDNMSRDNLKHSSGAYASTGYKLDSQSYPIHLYYKEGVNPVLCGELNDWISEVLRYVIKHADTGDKNTGSLLNYVVNGSTDAFLDADNEVITSQSDMESLMSFFQNFYVDWVGNILVNCGDQRIVVIPACLNPYTFTTMGSNTGQSLRTLLPLDPSSGTVSTAFIANYGTGNEIAGKATRSHTNESYADAMTKTGIAPMKNLVSVFGIKMLNDADFTSKNGDTITFKGGINASGKKADTGSILPLVMNKGGTKAPTWDFANNKVGTKGGSKLAETLRDSYGFVAQTNDNDRWTHDSNLIFVAQDTLCKKSEDNFDFLGYNLFLPQFMVYKAIRQSTDNSNTEFVVADLITNDDVINSGAFSNTGNSLHLDDSFNFNLAFTAEDTWMLQNMYLTYTYAYINGIESPSGTVYDANKHKVNMKFNNVFPRRTGTIEWDITDVMDESIREFTYYLLHPTKGLEYIATWFKNKISAIFLRWHEDIVGASDSNASTGMTKYLSFSGYVTTPALGDIDWISSFIDAYNEIIVYFIILMALILLMFVIANNITIQRGIIGFLAFAFLAFMPPALINFVIDTSNKVCDAIYSQKFSYWAIVQTNEYIGRLADVEGAGGTVDYISALYKATGVSTGDVDTGGESTGGYSGVKIKWLAPKKYNELGAFSDEVLGRIKDSKSGLSGWTVTGLAVGQENATGAEFFVDSDSATYLYRDILDIYRYGSTSYYADMFLNGSAVPKTERIGQNTKDIVGFTFEDAQHHVYTDVMLDNTKFADNMMANQKGVGSSGGNTPLDETNSLTYIRKGFLVDTAGMIDKDTGAVKDANKNYFTNAQAAGNLYYYGKHSSPGQVALYTIRQQFDHFKEQYKAGTINITPDAICKDTATQIGSHSSGCNFGIDQEYFKFGINEFINKQIPDSKMSFYQYGLYSESPYYYFSFNLRDHAKALHGYSYDYSEGGLTQNTQMYHMLLDDNQSYFYNYNVESGDGYGELRDFLNFHDMFYYVIPALTTGNDLVNAWASIYGMTPTTDISLKLGTDGNITYNGTTYQSIEDPLLKLALEDLDSESLYNFWLNYNIRTIYNCYTPWLYAMESCSYATKPETKHILGEKYVIENPMDPYSYHKRDASGNIIAGRYMVFSKSEQEYYGLLDSDLTEVERKLIAVGQNVYANALDLMNYYTICDENFIQSLVLMETFAFNKEFSQSSGWGKSFPLYPQSYELKAFTYDAYLRMIVAGSMEKNSDGERLQSSTRSGENKSIYARVQENTSIFFAIILIISDFIAVYIIPTLKIFFICLLFFVSLLVIISSVTGIEQPGGGILQAMWRSLIAPLLSFFMISVGMAFVVALFMSNGSDNITAVGMMPRIALGDPTTTVLAITVINTSAVILYWKVIKKLFSDFKTYFKVVFDNIGAAVTKAAKTASAVLGAGAALKMYKSLTGRGDGAVAGGSAKSRGRINTKPAARLGAGAAAAIGGTAATLTNKIKGRFNGSGEDVLDKYNKAKSENTSVVTKSMQSNVGLNRAKDKVAAIQARQDRLNQMHEAGMSDKLYSKRQALLDKQMVKAKAGEKHQRKLAANTALQDKTRASYKEQLAKNRLAYGRLGSIGANMKATANYARDSVKYKASRLGYRTGRLVGHTSNAVDATSRAARNVVNGGKAVARNTVKGAKAVGTEAKRLVTEEGHARMRMQQVGQVAKKGINATVRVANKAGGAVADTMVDAGRRASSSYNTGRNSTNRVKK